MFYVFLTKANNLQTEGVCYFASLIRKGKCFPCSPGKGIQCTPVSHLHAQIPPPRNSMRDTKESLSTWPLGGDRSQLSTLQVRLGHCPQASKETKRSEACPHPRGATLLAGALRTVPICPFSPCLSAQGSWNVVTASFP